MFGFRYLSLAAAQDHIVSVDFHLRQLRQNLPDIAVYPRDHKAKSLRPGELANGAVPLVSLEDFAVPRQARITRPP